MKKPTASMMRKAKNTIFTGGRSVAGTLFRPGNKPFIRWVRMSDEAFGNRNLETIDAGLFVRPGEDVEIAGLAAVPMRFHRRDLDRLILERVEPVLVADE